MAGADASSSCVGLARQTAHTAHEGQTDKAGEPYIGHPARVAARLSGDPDAEAVAWLHDVPEDTSTTMSDLADLGFPEDIVHAVDALTRRPGETPDDYYARVAADPLARRVKLADLDDNSDPARLARLPDDVRERLVAKYAHARRRLR